MHLNNFPTTDNVYSSYGSAPLQVKGLITVCADVSDMATVKAELSKLRPIHLLVNNAGVGQLQHFLDVTPESYDRYIM